jgi:protein-tyrosine phosphatase
VTAAQKIPNTSWDMEDRTKVVFVCTGNICRSPTAEGVFRHLVREAGLSHRFEIDSAGTSSYHIGEAPDPRSAATAERRGVPLTGVARKLRSHDLDEFDFVILMDGDNLAAVEQLAGGTRANVRLLREFDADAAGNLDVPDPYYGGSRGFDNVYDIIERSCRSMLDEIRRERGW